MKTSLTDVPFAVNDAELLAELGWNIWDNERDINDGLFSESVMRKLIAKYNREEWVTFYNHYVQDFLIKKMDLQPTIHILDCTKIPVNLKNENYLKSERKVDTYLPAKENMILFQDAVKLASSCGKWHKHPDWKRKTQEIQLVTDLGSLWESSEPGGDVPINTCVVHDQKTDKYFVFMTTDTEKTARQIIETYELRPEREEDFRQMKDFWKSEDFKSTKYNYITYHIVMTLIGYLFFQIYENLEEGQAYIGKSLPVVVKNHKEVKPKSVVIYVDQYFGIFPFLEFLQLYTECTLEVRQLLDPILPKVYHLF
ncbi:MAG: transposase [Bacilli bacterium]